MSDRSPINLVALLAYILGASQITVPSYHVAKRQHQDQLFMRFPIAHLQKLWLVHRRKCYHFPRCTTEDSSLYFVRLKINLSEHRVARRLRAI